MWQVQLTFLIAGVLLPAILPYIQLGFLYSFWEIPSSKKPAVDRKKCKCPCWDTIFKGSYQNWPAGYKHMYFNITWNTLCMWVLTVIAVIAIYEATVYIVKLAVRRRLRPSMLILAVASLYPNYFTWWVMINMWNDDFYSQCVHQSYFSATEIISTVVIIYLCDKQHPLTRRLLLVITTVALFHTGASSWDQFFHNVLYGKGKPHQQFRDLALMISDLFNLVVSVGHLILLYKEVVLRSGTQTMRRELLIAGLIAFSLICINTMI